MSKRISDMTPADHRRKLYRALIAWAAAADAQYGNPYHCVDSHGEPWNYAASFLDYTTGEESIGALDRHSGQSVLFLLMVAATVEID